MIPSSELPAAIVHVAGAAHRRLLLIAPAVDPKVEAVIRGHVARGVAVEVRLHPRIKALVADDALGLILTGSLTPQTTGWALAEDEARNVEGAVLVTEPQEIAALLTAATGPLRP